MKMDCISDDKKQRGWAVLVLNFHFSTFARSPSKRMEVSQSFAQWDLYDRSAGQAEKLFSPELRSANVGKS